MVYLIRAELRKAFLLGKAYIFAQIADVAFFVTGFLLMTGIFSVATDGSFGDGQLTALIGYYVWRTAGAVIRDNPGSIGNDAKWGTLEQIWLSNNSLLKILFARNISIVLSTTLRASVIAFFIMFILDINPQIAISELPGLIVIYLFTLISPFGLALMFTGYQLVFQRSSAFSGPLATAMLFLTGALVPFESNQLLYTISRILPLGVGIDLMRELVDGLGLIELLTSIDFVILLTNSVVYLSLGIFVISRAKAAALAKGSLAHY